VPCSHCTGCGSTGWFDGTDAGLTAATYPPSPISPKLTPANFGPNNFNSSKSTDPDPLAGATEYSYPSTGGVTITCAAVNGQVCAGDEASIAAADCAVVDFCLAEEAANASPLGNDYAYAAVLGLGAPGGAADYPLSYPFMLEAQQRVPPTVVIDINRDSDSSVTFGNHSMPLISDFVGVSASTAGTGRWELQLVNATIGSWSRSSKGNDMALLASAEPLLRLPADWVDGFDETGGLGFTCKSRMCSPMGCCSAPGKCEAVSDDLPVIEMWVTDGTGDYPVSIAPSAYLQYSSEDKACYASIGEADSKLRPGIDFVLGTPFFLQYAVVLDFPDQRTVWFDKAAATPTPAPPAPPAPPSPDIPDVPVAPDTPTDPSTPTTTGMAGWVVWLLVALAIVALGGGLACAYCCWKKRGTGEGQYAAVYERE